MRRRALAPALAILASAGLATAASRRSLAQGRRAESDASEVRTDALLGTANRATPVPQSNRFSTAPRLEQQAPGTDSGAPVGPGGAGEPAGGGRR
ncbi:MAG: hypothetical protein KIS73_18445 [Enhydrobacter sp.]|nr:hypothetical protein [Enhydrobacter sp.]